MEVVVRCWGWWKGGWGLGNLQGDLHQGGNHPGNSGKMREDLGTELEMKLEDHRSSWGKIQLEDPFLGLSCLEAALKVRYIDHQGLKVRYN